MGDQGVAAYVFLINNKCDHTYENQPVSKKIKYETGNRHDPPLPPPPPPPHTHTHTHTHTYTHTHTILVELIKTYKNFFFPCCMSSFQYINILGRSIKIHLYWAMKNCGEDPDKLRALIECIGDHYQVNIIQC